jgi:hypothetical protein
MSCISYCERLIAKQCIADLLAAGFKITVNDGEDDVLVLSTDPEAILKVMFSADEDQFYVTRTHEGKTQNGWVRFIYGNDGYDVINDCPTNLEEVLTKTEALCDEMES